MGEFLFLIFIGLLASAVQVTVAFGFAIFFWPKYFGIKQTWNLPWRKKD